MDTMIVFQSKVDKHKFEVEEAVAMQFQSVKDHYITIKHKNIKEPTYRFDSISQKNLSKVIDYCKNHVDDDDDDVSTSSFDIEFVKQLDHPVTLFNIIQAAHHLKIKSLMDLTCRTLVDKVKRKTYGKIMTGFNIRSEYFQPSVAKRVKRVVAPSGLQNSGEECRSMNFNSILRNCKPETFLMESKFVDVQFSPFVTSQTYFINRRRATYDRYVREIMESRNFDQLLEPISHLEELINRDLGLAYHLKSGVVRYLVMMLKMTNNRRHTHYIQCQVVSILSRARFDICGDVLEKDAVPLLVKLVPKYCNTLATKALVALTRLAYASPVHVKVIIDNGALEAVHEVINKVRGTNYIMGYVTKFLVAVCRGYNLYPDNFPSEKVAVVLTIIEDLFYKETASYSHLVLACYALLYLSHGRCVALTGEAYERLIGRLIDFISIANTSLAGSATGVVGNIGRLENLNKIAGSALGVVGNIARWGNSNQVQFLAKDHQLMQCLRKDVICSEFKKFRKEACKIVANIAARSEILIKDMIEAGLIEPLCSLLEDDESDVRIEAAWALFNGVNGYEYAQIDVYPSENENKPHVSERTLAQTKRRKAKQQWCCLSPTSPSGVSSLPFYSMVGRDRIPLMEVFKLIYLSHDELEPEKQCGTIKMICGSDVQFLYNVQEIDMSKPTIKYGDDILVTVKGPTCSFACLDMQFDLFSGAYKDSIEVEWDWDECVVDDVLFEERRIVSRDGTGEICVLMGLFFDATVANLAVKLVDNSSATNVYGVVLASNSKLDIPKCTSVLFEKKPDNVTQVGDEGLIPLSKSRLGVPMNSVLHVDISLNVNGVNYTASSSFDAKKIGEYSQFYSSENKVVIQVQVTWDA